ncbi:MAG: DUF4835 family protein [Bacteroidota bacterium]
MKKLLLTFILPFFLFNNLISQEIRATVSVNMEQIDPDKRIFVSSLENDLQNYINNQQFVNIEWEGERIPVDINIVLSGGNRNRFSAKMYIVSRRPLLDDAEATSVAVRLLENKWAFSYSQGANLTFNINRFDEITSIIDFYMMLIIGMDLDSYGELDGNVAFDRAKQVLLLGANQGVEGWGTYAAPGELTKYTLISELTDPRYHNFRKLITELYLDGMDLLAKNKQKALGNIAQTISKMADFKEKRMVGPSAFLQMFFDTKSREFAALFKGYPDAKVFDNLIYLDPTNAHIYNEARR